MAPPKKPSVDGVIERALEATIVTKDDPNAKGPPMAADDKKDADEHRTARRNVVAEVALANLDLVRQAAKTLRAETLQGDPAKNRGISSSVPSEATQLLESAADAAAKLSPKEREAKVLEDLENFARDRTRIMNTEGHLNDKQKLALQADDDAIRLITQANPEIARRAISELTQGAKSGKEDKAVAAGAAQEIASTLKGLDVNLKGANESELQRPAKVPKVQGAAGKQHAVGG